MTDPTPTDVASKLHDLIAKYGSDVELTDPRIEGPGIVSFTVGTMQAGPGTANPRVIRYTATCAEATEAEPTTDDTPGGDVI